MKLLFEIGMEEIPARFLSQALTDLKTNFEKKLKNNRIKYEGIKTYGTPRRLVLVVDEVAEMQEDLNELNIGPSKERAYKDGELSKAGEGFLNNLQLKKLQILFQRIYVLLIYLNSLYLLFQILLHYFHIVLKTIL